MKKYTIILFSLFALRANAQFIPKQITINLMPVVVSSNKYYFDSKRIKFEEIVLPLISFNDKKINNYIKVIHILKDTRGLLILAPTLLFFYLNHDPNSSLTNFDLTRNILFGTFVALVTLDIVDMLLKHKTINRYNNLVLAPSASFLPGNELKIGLQFGIRF